MHAVTHHRKEGGLAPSVRGSSLRTQPLIGGTTVGISWLGQSGGAPAILRSCLLLQVTTRDVVVSRSGSKVRLAPCLR